MTSLNDWTVIDIHWPTSHLASSNLQFLKDKGCCTMEADLFGVDWHSIAEGKQTKAITFVLSNLNWRQRNFEVISSYGWQDRSKQALYGLVIRFLRAQVPRCHIIIVCRRKDGIHEHLWSEGYNEVVLFLGGGICHHAMQAVPLSDPSQTAANDIAEGGGQIVVMIPAPGMHNIPMDEGGFDLPRFLCSTSSRVWFIGEGDCRLAVACAKAVLDNEASLSSAVADKEVDSQKRRRRSGASDANINMMADVQRVRDVFAKHEKWKVALLAAAFLYISEGVNVEARCRTCNRISAPEAEDWTCCRTCAKTNGDEHGPVCNSRELLVSQVLEKAPGVDK